MTMKEENNGTAIVTPDKHSAYMRPMFPKKMHTPEAMAKPIRGAFSCRTCNSIQRRTVEAPSGFYSIALLAAAHTKMQHSCRQLLV